MGQYITFEVMEGAYDIACPDQDCPAQVITYNLACPDQDCPAQVITYNI